MKKQDFRYETPNAGRRAEDISNVVEDLSRPRTMMYSVLALVIAIVSLAISGLGGWVGLALAALSITFAIVSRRHLGYFDGKTIAGLVIGICGAVSSVATIVLIQLLESGALDAYLAALFEGIEEAPGAGDAF